MHLGKVNFFVWLLGRIKLSTLGAFALIIPTAIWLFGESILPREQAYVLCDRLAPYFTAWENWHKWPRLHSEIVLLYFGSILFGVCLLFINLIAFETYKPLYWGRSVPRWVLYGYLNVQFKNRRKTVYKHTLIMLVCIILFTMNTDLLFLDEKALLDTTGAPRGRKDLVLHASQLDFLLGGMAFYAGSFIYIFPATVITSLITDSVILTAYRMRISWLRRFKQHEKAEQLEARLIARDEQLMHAQTQFQQQHGLRENGKKTHMQ